MNRFFDIILLVILAVTTVTAEELQGVVVDVHDGDTYTMRTDDGRILKVRQAGIDAPELKQELGDYSADFNFYLLQGRHVKVTQTSNDRYGRVIGKTQVLVGDKWFDAESIMLHHGLAWHYTQYDKSQELTDAENYAKERKFGIWSNNSNPTAPWQFRRNKKVLQWQK